MIDHESLSEFSEGNGYEGRGWSELAKLKVKRLNATKEIAFEDSGEWSSF
jgi:hypothetical protein